jgi:hypothetical protein
MLSALNIERVSLLSSDGCLGVGISENEIKDHFSVYPNPAYDALTLRSDMEGISGFELLNVVGESVLTSMNEMVMHKETVLDISSQSPGIYFLRVHANGSSAVYKVVKR